MQPVYGIICGMDNKSNGINVAALGDKEGGDGRKDFVYNRF